MLHRITAFTCSCSFGPSLHSLLIFVGFVSKFIDWLPQRSLACETNLSPSCSQLDYSAFVYVWIGAVLNCTCMANFQIPLVTM